MSRGIKVRDQTGFLGPLSAVRVSCIVYARDFLPSDPDATVGGGSASFSISIPDFDATKGVLFSRTIVSTYQPWWVAAHIRDNDSPNVYWLTFFVSEGTWNNSTKTLALSVSTNPDGNGNPVGRSVYGVMFA